MHAGLRLHKITTGRDPVICKMTSTEIPEDPSDWTDEDMLILVLYRLGVEEGILPDIVFNGIWIAVENFAHGVAIAMSDDAVRWFRIDDAGESAMNRICSMLEKQVLVKDWNRHLK